MNIETVKCKYIFKDDYNPLYVNGAQGGISTLGEIVINFYLERHALPISQSFSVDSTGRIGDEKAVEPEDLKSSYVRVIQNGVVLNYQTAKEIHKWLGEHIQILEQINDANKTSK